MQRELISKKSRIENNLPEMKYTSQLASEKGAPSWFNALPLSKRNNYEERIRETEHSSFNALVFACSGGVGRGGGKAALSVWLLNFIPLLIP